MEGYAVSGQCMALVRDNCLVPTKDAPELGYVRGSSDKQFVPDVYYKVSTLLMFSQFLFSLEVSCNAHLPFDSFSLVCVLKQKNVKVKHKVLFCTFIEYVYNFYSIVVLSKLFHLF